MSHMLKKLSSGISPFLWFYFFPYFYFLDFFLIRRNRETLFIVGWKNKYVNETLSISDLWTVCLLKLLNIHIFLFWNLKWKIYETVAYRQRLRKRFTMQFLNVLLNRTLKSYNIKYIIFLEKFLYLNDGNSKQGLRRFSNQYTDTYIYIEWKKVKKLFSTEKKSKINVTQM